MKLPRHPAKPPANLPEPPEQSPSDLPEDISASLRRHLQILVIACESFIPGQAEGGPSREAAADHGRIWVYLPALPSDDETAALRSLASELAGQYGLTASVIVKASSVTVILERRETA